MRGVGGIAVLVAPVLLVAGGVSGVVVQGELHRGARGARRSARTPRGRASGPLARGRRPRGCRGTHGVARPSRRRPGRGARGAGRRRRGVRPQCSRARTRAPGTGRAASTEEFRTAADDLVRWSGRLDRWARTVADETLGPSVAALREATLAAAGTARTAALSVLDEHPAASEDSRAALASAIPALEDVLARGAPAAAAVGSVTSAAQAVKDSAAEAAAAEAAESSGGGGCPGPSCGSWVMTYEMAYGFCHLPPLMWTPPGSSEPVPSGPSFPCTVSGPGYEWTFYE